MDQNQSPQEALLNLSHTSISLPPRLSCIIFDWDGTLLDSSITVIKAHQRALIELDLPDVSSEKLQLLLGCDKVQVCNTLTQGSSIPPMTYYRCFNRHYLELFQHLKLFSTSMPLLQLAQSCDIQLALATNKTSTLVREELEQTGSINFFDYLTFADLSEAKPSPKMLNDSLAFFSCPQDKCIMVGDQTADINAAHAAGIMSITLVGHTLPSWAQDYQDRTTFCRHTDFLKALGSLLS